MRERSADGGAPRKPNKPRSNVGISYILQRRETSLGPARPRKCLTALDQCRLAQILLGVYLNPGRCAANDLQEEPL
jgi:hypothetical protein